MSDNRELTRATNQDLETMRFDDALESYTPNLAAVLPDHIPVDRFKRVVLTAVNITPELGHADRRSLFNACAKCAHDGLYPDGREAALVVFRTKVKRKVTENGRVVDREFYADLVQYLPMIAGIRKRMRNTGAVLSADAQIVCQSDKFHYEFGDDPKIVHEPPPLGTERGKTIGAYAVIKLANGEVLREVMGRPEIERVRAFSRNATGDRSPWTTSWDEMARKTVLRRCSKASPTGSDIERLLSRDEELPQITSQTPLQQIPSAPRREQFEEDLVEHLARERFEEDGKGGVRPIKEFTQAVDNLTEAVETLTEATKKELDEELDEANRLREEDDEESDDPETLEKFREAVARDEPDPPPSSLVRTKIDEPPKPSLFIALRAGAKIGSTDWAGTAQAMIALIETLTDPEDTRAGGRFEQDNREALGLMRSSSDKRAWSSVKYRLSDRHEQVRKAKVS